VIDNSIIQATGSWPFIEARKLIKERKKIYEKKGKITLQTGYGPKAYLILAHLVKLLERQWLEKR